VGGTWIEDGGTWIEDGEQVGGTFLSQIGTFLSQIEGGEQVGGTFLFQSISCVWLLDQLTISPDLTMSHFPFYFKLVARFLVDILL